MVLRVLAQSYQADESKAMALGPTPRTSTPTGRASPCPDCPGYNGGGPGRIAMVERAYPGQNGAQT